MGRGQVEASVDTGTGRLHAPRLLLDCPLPTPRLGFTSCSVRPLIMIATSAE